MIKLVTHNQGFHADDVMAYAILKEVLTKRGETWTIARTRDEQIIKDADIAFDIGFEYDPARNRYDHHQAGRAGARENGVLYAACGLVWKHFGRELCSDEAVWQAVDNGMVAYIDAKDSGQEVVKETYFEDVHNLGIGSMLSMFEPTMFEEKNAEIILNRFEEASEFARGVLRRLIHNEDALQRAFLEARKIYEGATDKQILIFDKDYERETWRRLAVFPEPLFVVYRNSRDRSDDWRAEAIRISPKKIQSRKPAPEAWWGLRDEDLQKASGVTDARFCHPSGFLMGAKSFDGALKLAKIAVSM